MKNDPDPLNEAITGALLCAAVFVLPTFSAAERLSGCRSSESRLGFCWVGHGLLERSPEGRQG